MQENKRGRFFSEHSVYVRTVTWQSSTYGISYFNECNHEYLHVHDEHVRRDYVAVRFIVGLLLVDVKLVRGLVSGIYTADADVYAL